MGERWWKLWLAGLLASLEVASVLPARSATATAPDPAKRLSQYVHDVWQTEDGLPANDVQAIVHGRDGFLWLATRGGLVRFDGVGFRVFNMVRAPILGTDDLGALAEGPDGSLWIGSRGAGLYRYHEGGLTSHSDPDPARSDLRALAVDRDRRLWAGSLGGLLRLEGDRLEAVDSPLVHDADIRALHVDAEGTLWIGTRGRGVLRHRDGRFEAVAGVEGREVRAVLHDGDALWVGTDDGLLRVGSGRVIAYGRADGLIDEGIRALHRDAAGSLWIGTDSGVARFRDGRFEGLALRADAADLVRALIVDREGSLWVGSYGSGLHRFKGGAVTVVSELEGLSRNGVMTVFEEASGELLAGFGGGGVDRLKGGVATSLADATAFGDATVLSLYVDRQGTLWAGTTAGLVRTRGGRSRIYTTADGLPDDRVRIVLDDPDQPDTLWLGTFSGVASLSGDGVRTWPALPQENVRALLKDRDGVLWIGTERGLARFAGGEVSVLTTADGLASNAIRALYEDAEGSLWIGTRGGGLARRRGGELTAYTTRQGLPHNDAWAIVEDDGGQLWWSSDQGLARARKADFDAVDQGRLASVSARVYGLADGMKVVECNGVGYPSGLKAADGRLYFASMGGVVAVDPRPPPVPAPPPVYVESLVAGGRPADLGGPIELEPGQRNLEIAYTSPYLRDPTAVAFRYRLAPYERDWIDAGTRRSAFYTNLPPGTYRFLAVAGSDDAGWQGGGASLAFTLAPRFWETRWFWSVSALLLAAAVYIGYRLRTRGIRARTRQLRREIDRRERVEAALRASEAKFATVYRAGPDAVVLSTLDDGTFLDVNDGFRRLTGYRRRDLIGRTSSDIGLWVDLEDRARIAELLRSGDVARNLESTFRRRSGDTFACQISAGLIEIEGRTAVVSVIRDVSERQRAERERERLIGELEAKNQELERFTYTVSHDLKAPLVTIRGFLGLVKKDAAAVAEDPRAAPRLDRDLARIDAAAAKMGELLEDLLELSKVGRHSGSIESVALGKVAREAAERVAGGLAGRGVEVRIDPDLPAVRGDRARLVDMLQNLLDNAARYLGDQPSPEIEVGVRPGPDTGDSVFYVRDNGIGIAAEYHDKIFELFQRLDADTQGTGVGLALVKRIVEVHGGRIWVESEGAGCGSTFCFTLPGVAADEDAREGC